MWKTTVSRNQYKVIIILLIIKQKLITKSTKKIYENLGKSIIKKKYYKKLKKEIVITIVEIKICQTWIEKKKYMKNLINGVEEIENV